MFNTFYLFFHPSKLGFLAIILRNKVGIGNIIPRWACNSIPNRLAVKSGNFNFWPIFAKIDDVTLMKNEKIGQKLNFPECDGDRKPRMLAAQNS